MSLATMKKSHYAKGAVRALQASRGGAWLLPLFFEAVHIDVPIEVAPVEIAEVLE